MPGVIVSTSTRGGPTTALKLNSGQWFVVGMAERGPTTSAVVCRGMADFSLNFGNRVSYSSLYDAVQLFFNEGGDQCYVARIVGDSPASGTLTLNDGAVSAGLPTLRVDAANPGAWSANMTVQVQAGLLPATFRLTVYLSGNIVEDYNNLVSPDVAANKFNTSPYVRVTNLGSATASPNNNPRVVGPVALSTGTDDAGTVDPTNYAAGLNLFLPGYGDGAVSIPGQGSAIHSAVIAHCIANQRVALLATTRGASRTDLVSLGGTQNTEYAGIFAPWVLISDGAGGSRAVSPEGYVAACRSNAHSAVGAWRVPAGQNSISRSLVGIDQDFTSTDSNTLDGAHISVIRNVLNSIRLYGWRSLSTDEDNYSYLSSRDLLNNLVILSENELEEYVFAPIDNNGQLLSAIQAKLVGMVDPIAVAGGLYALLDDNGQVIDPGYSVDTSPAVNNASTLAQNQVNAVLSVRVSPTGASVNLNIVKVGIKAGV